MLTKLLHTCGLYLGPESDLMPAQADNPDGFWENLRFVALNDEVLDELGGAWDLPPKADENFKHPRLDPLRTKAQLLVEGFDSATVWGWKDPRNSLTLPFWQDLLPKLKTLIIVRNPLEVAYSMRARNGTSYSFGLRLWEIYNRRAIETSSEQQRLVTHYDLFFEDAETELRRIAQFIGLPNTEVDSAAALVIKQRRHTHFTIDQLIDARVSTEVIELYNALIAEANQSASASVTKKNERKRERAPQAAKPGEADFLPGAVSRPNASIPERENVRWEHLAQIENLEGEIRQLALRLARQDGRIAEMEANAARHEKERAEYQSEIRQLALRIAEMETNAARHEKARADYQSEIEKIREDLMQTNQLLDARSISLANSEAQRDELRDRLREQLQVTKKLSRLLDDVGDAATRLRSSRRWKLANPVTVIKAKLSPGRVSAGYGHLEKIVKAYSQWRASRPEIGKIDDEIKALRLEDLSFELVQPQFKIPGELLPDRPMPVDVKAIAFYLPQFHRIPQNDAWWGEGFTEWTNVRRGSPNFQDHYQPHVPAADLGYYDLTNEGVLEKQAALAGAAGIHGFCFHYYWFGGEVLLDLPVRKILETGKPEIPFCICWANENWTRRWDGKDSEILIAQRHSPEDDLNFIRHVEKILATKNYIRVDGKPLLLVYRPSLLPDAKETLQRWRSYFRGEGHGDLHLVMVQSFSERASPSDYGFDAGVQFPPHFAATPVTSLIRDKHHHFAGAIYDYGELRKKAIDQFRSAPRNLRLYPGVMPSWDNTARQQSRSTIWVNSSPEAYSEWLAEVAGLARGRLSHQERFIFINSWNEWAEGCHLEPDEKYGYAWLNATALALGDPVGEATKEGPRSLHPQSPTQEAVDVSLLKGQLKLAISVLFYHREDLLASFLESILPQIARAESQGDITCSLNLAFNYQPSANVISELKQILSNNPALNEEAIQIFENGFNLGFGAGHNLIFDKSASDIFLVLNSDVRVRDKDWLQKLIDRFRHSKSAIIGLTQTASRLRDDACGVPIETSDEEFDFVDGSVLAIRSDLVRRFGLFSPIYDYFYFEDVDLCLRYRQMGFEIGLLDVPYAHERSSSSRLLPQFAVEGVLNRNRARFFEKWGKYLRTRTLSNRIGIHFLDIDRQLQCASLPALFGLLTEHRTAVLDLWGVHEQLAQFFKHPRIRLIPSWQRLREDDYLRYYELATDQSETPRVYDIANRMGCDPNFEATKVHLESLIGSSVRENSRSSKTALLYVARKSPLFDGKEPDAESFAPVAKMLRERNFEVRFYTDYGTFEVQGLHNGAISDWNYSALSPGVELLKEVAAADLLVTSDNWIGELGQLLQKRTFVWLGATSSAAAIWDFERASCFTDQSLPCLGCYHQFGRNHHNVCLRGDIACMKSQLNGDFVASLEAFLDGKRLKAADIRSEHLDSRPKRTMPSEQLSLEHWPSSTANSVLVLTPVNPNLDERVLQHAKDLANRALKGMQNCRVVYDNHGDAPLRGQPHPHRQAAMAALRQSMIERYLKNEKWVFWVDADIVDYPPNLLDQLIARAEGGIAAPLVIMEGDVSEPAFPSGFGPGRFYDIGGFVEDGRWARFTEPYFNQLGPVYHLDSVGSCYLVNADLYRRGARHEADLASSRFLSNGSPWAEDSIRRNQEAPANCYTEHYSVCQFAWRAGLPVQAFADLIAYHQKP